MIKPVLVVNPYIHDFKLYDEWMHPAGLYYLMDLLASNNVPVFYFNCLERDDSRVRKYGTGGFVAREIPRPPQFSEIRRKYKRYGCDESKLRDFCASLPEISTIFVGSMMTYWADGVIAAIRILQECLPHVPVVLGGIAAQLVPYYFKQQLPDITVYEKALPQKGETVSFPGMDSILAAPAEYSLRNGFLKAKPLVHGMILASTGCPMRCSYCASQQLQPHFMQRPITLVADEMATLIRHCNVEDFAFYDDALLVKSDELLLPVLHHILADGWKIRLHTPNGLHIRYLTAPLLDLMKRAGFTTLRFGYESGLSKNRTLTSGKTDASMVEEKLKLLESFRFRDVGLYMMGGLPGGTPDELAGEMEHIAALHVRVKPVFLSPVPGTELFDAYSSDFHEVAYDPHWHNDTFFITKLPGWNEDAVDRIRGLARHLNAGVTGS